MPRKPPLPSLSLNYVSVNFQREPSTGGARVGAAGKVEDRTTVLGLWLDVDVNADPIKGTLRLPGGHPEAFVGWLGLTAALDRIRARAAAGDHAVPEELEPLTPTERNVVVLVCQGLTNPQIARRLGVSPRTIQGHLLNVFKKLGVSSRTQLVARMLRAHIDLTKDEQGMENQ